MSYATTVSTSTATTSFTASISGATLTVSAISAGMIGSGMLLQPPAVPVGSQFYVINAAPTNTPGTFTLSASPGTVASESMTGVTTTCTVTVPCPSGRVATFTGRPDLGNQWLDIYPTRVWVSPEGAVAIDSGAELGRLHALGFVTAGVSLCPGGQFSFSFVVAP